MKFHELKYPEGIRSSDVHSVKVRLVEDRADVSVYLRFNHSLNAPSAKTIRSAFLEGFNRPLLGFSNEPFLVRFSRSVTTIRSDAQYRSLAATFGWALSAGVLTGGVGALFGAAWGGRRRGESFFAIDFEGDISALVSTVSAKEINQLNRAEETGSTRKLSLLDIAAEAEERRYRTLAAVKRIAAFPK